MTRLHICCLAVVTALPLGACGGPEPAGRAQPAPGGVTSPSGAASGSADEGEGRYGYGAGDGTIQLGGEAANDHGSTSAEGRDALTLELDDFYFEPTVIAGNPREALTLRLVNEGSTAHTFTLQDQGIDIELQPGARARAEVTFPASGLVTFVCRFHAGAGMRGALQVR